MALMKINHGGLLPSFANIWEDFFGNDITDLAGQRRRTTLPAVNIEEKPDHFLVCLALPGMQREDLKIEVDQGILSVSAEVEESSQDTDTAGNFTRREFNYQSFKRSFTLPDSVKADALTAKYEDGILRIHLPKQAAAQAQPIRHIPIN